MPPASVKLGREEYCDNLTLRDRGSEQVDVSREFGYQQSIAASIVVVKSSISAVKPNRFGPQVLTSQFPVCTHRLTTEATRSMRL